MKNEGLKNLGKDKGENRKMNLEKISQCPLCKGEGKIYAQKLYPEDNSGIVDFWGGAVNELRICDLCNGTRIDPELPKMFEIVLSRLYDSIEILDNLLNHRDRMYAMRYYEERLSDHKLYLKSLEDL